MLYEARKSATRLVMHSFTHPFPPFPGQAGFNIKPLFRKLATALPGMESAQSQGSTNLIDIKLAAAPAASSDQAEARSRCAC